MCSSLRPADIQFMLNIHEKVNVIPIISKADMLTEKEKSKVKQRINDAIKEHGIKVSLKITLRKSNSYLHLTLRFYLTQVPSHQLPLI